MKTLALLCGNANKPLAEAIANILQLPLTKCAISHFPDQELKIELQSNELHDRNVVIIQPTCPPVNDNLMELILLASAAKQAGAASICAVIPYFGYARQNTEYIDNAHAPHSAKIIIKMLPNAGIDQILTLDLHATEIIKFFPKGWQNITSREIFAPFCAKQKFINPAIVAVDTGSIARAIALAAALNVNHLIILEKQPQFRKNFQLKKTFGHAKNQHCILIDDIVDTATTICLAAELLHAAGASKISAYCTHAILSPGAREKINNSAITEIVVTNSVQLSDAAINCAKLRQLSIAAIVAQAIEEIRHPLI